MTDSRSSSAADAPPQPGPPPTRAQLEAELDATRQELHLECQRCVAGMINGSAPDRHDDPGGVGGVPARLIAFHPTAVKRGDELHFSERKLVRPADVHRMTGGALIGAELRQLVRRDDGRLVLLGQRDRVTEVVAVAVGQQDTVELGQFIRPDDGRRIAGEEWIDDEALAVPL